MVLYPNRPCLLLMRRLILSPSVINHNRAQEEVEVEVEEEEEEKEEEVGKLQAAPTISAYP
jgi:hypothetical protein